MPLYALDGRRPALPPEGRYWIAPSACLIGDVSVGIDVGIWFGAVLRGDNEPIDIGARTNIQDFCTLHTDMGYPLSIGDDCTIGHNAILHGCVIGEGSLVGMGAVVLNGARIGRGCLVGGARAGDGGQGLRRPFAHRRFARQGRPHARRRGAPGPSPLRPALRGELAPLRVGTEADRRRRVVIGAGLNGASGPPTTDFPVRA